MASREASTRRYLTHPTSKQAESILTDHPVSICTLGAAEHGKTAVTRAILRQLSPSELDREGVLRSRHYTFRTVFQTYHHYDPNADGVAKHFANQVSGLDGAILVISAVEGVTAEARHHVQLARFAQVPVILPVMSKCDVEASRSKIRRLRGEVAALLGAFEFRVFEVFPMGGFAAGETTEAPILLLAEMMDRYFRSRYAV
jgi:selenocysteine-specific elongation factor